MKQYLAGLTTAGIIAVQFLDFNTSAYYVTAGFTIALLGATILAFKVGRR